MTDPVKNLLSPTDAQPAPVSPLNTSISHYEHSEVSALEDLPSAGPVSAISTPDEDRDGIIISHDHRVPFNQMPMAGPSTLRHAENIDQQETGVVAADGTVITEPQPNPIITQQPRPKPLPSTNTRMRSPYAVPPGEDPRDYVVPLQSLKDISAPVDCPRCHERAMTRIEKVSGSTVTTWALILCCLTGLLCSWVPCVIDDCKDTCHRCGNCNFLLATASNGGGVTVHVPPIAVRSQYAPQPPKEQTRELDAVGNKIIGAEAQGNPVSELELGKQVSELEEGGPKVRAVGGPPQEIGISDKGKKPDDGGGGENQETETLRVPPQ